MKLFVVGKALNYNEQSWEFDGIYSIEEKAIERCAGRPHYFIGPVTLDQDIPEDVIEWPGAYYPCDME